MRVLATVTVMLLTAVRPGLAQMPAPDGAENRAAMERVRFLEGRWRGQAWYQRGPNQRDTTAMVETVDRKLGGVALLIEGRGTMPVTGGGERVVHHALAVLTYDATTKSYSMRSWLANGLAGDFPVTVGTNEIAWTREVPGGKVRNTARFTTTEWHEISEFSRDGATWTPVTELKLRKDP